MTDPVSSLREAGVPVDQMNAAQQAVLATLSADEAAVLVSVQRRLLEAEDEVVAHGFKLL